MKKLNEDKLFIELELHKKVIQKMIESAASHMGTDTNQYKYWAAKKTGFEEATAILKKVLK